MKKLTIFLLSVCISVSSFATSSGVENPTVDNKTEIMIRNQKMLDRLEEINRMDKSKLTRSEKRELRKEVKEIQKTMEIGGGVYISVGALILILILLIILL